MTQKDFQKLSRAELLEILLAQAEEIDRLQHQCNDLQQKLDERKIKIDQAGSIAEASLKINAVFEAAQAAAEEYLQNVRAQGEPERVLISKARRLLIETERRCAEMERATMMKCDAMLRAVMEDGATKTKKPFRPEDFIW